MKRIHTIVTHRSPHIDEIAAILFLRTFGNQKYPGIDNADIVFWDAGTITPDGRSWKEWHKEGYLLIGVGGSCFDEHTTNGRKEYQCAASLVAEDLGIRKDLYLKKVLDYVIANDTKGGTNPMDIAAITRLANEQWSNQPMKALEFSLTMLELRLFDQMDFHITAKEEFENYSKTVLVNHNEKTIKVVFAESNHDRVAAYARSEFGGKADVVVVRKQSGNVVIVTNKAKVDLDNVIMGLRDCEAKMKNQRIASGYLSLAGVIKHAEEWYYDKTSNQILNGSKSAPNVPPTKIDFKKLKKIIIGRLGTEIVQNELSIAS